MSLVGEPQPLPGVRRKFGSCWEAAVSRAGGRLKYERLQGQATLKEEIWPLFLRVLLLITMRTVSVMIREE